MTKVNVTYPFFCTLALYACQSMIALITEKNSMQKSLLIAQAKPHAKRDWLNQFDLVTRRGIEAAAKRGKGFCKVQTLLFARLLDKAD
jgi:hypothetical protein